MSKAAFRWVLVLGAAVPIVAVGTPAWAKPPGHGGSTSSSTTGIDVSWPQCPATSLPSGEAFAIVGVNGGLANDYNGCLGTEFSYAQKTPGTSGQPPAQLYLNTADPGNSVADWPSPSQLGADNSNSTPYGTCGYASGTSGTSGPGAESQACAYIYGYDMVLGIIYSGGGDVIGDVTDFNDATGQHLYEFPTWLDVETANTWQSGSSGQAMNVADLQGMVAGLDAAATAVNAPAPTIGVYSTSSQWGQITGNPGLNGPSTLWGIPDWIPGARTASGAASNCSLAAFTNSGHPAITQWFGHPYDGDYPCPTTP